MRISVFDIRIMFLLIASMLLLQLLSTICILGG
jgi:hypothetical protein